MRRLIMHISQTRSRWIDFHRGAKAGRGGGTAIEALKFLGGRVGGCPGGAMNSALLQEAVQAPGPVVNRTGSRPPSPVTSHLPPERIRIGTKPRANVWFKGYYQA